MGCIGASTLDRIETATTHRLTGLVSPPVPSGSEVQ
jgi:hypothetical protein